MTIEIKLVSPVGVKGGDDDARDSDWRRLETERGEGPLAPPSGSVRDRFTPPGLVSGLPLLAGPAGRIVCAERGTLSSYMGLPARAPVWSRAGMGPAPTGEDDKLAGCEYACCDWAGSQYATPTFEAGGERGVAVPDNDCVGVLPFFSLRG